MSVLATGDRRLEGETYLASGYGIRRRIEGSGSPFERLSRLGNVWQPSRLKGIGVAREHGKPFLTATQVFDLVPAPRKWLALERVPDLQKRYVEGGWILITRSGSVGDSILSYAPLLDVIVSDDLLRLEVRNPKQRGYIYAFLRSRMGRALLRSNRYGSIIKHLEPEHVQDVPILLPVTALVDAIGVQIDKVFQLRDKAYSLISEAEERFAAALAVKPKPQGEESAFSVQATALFQGMRRLDAYHYNPKAQATEAVLRRAKHPTETLAAVTDNQIFGVPRFKHVYTESGTPYLDSEDLFKVNPEITKFIPRISKKDTSTYFVERGWLLMACSGQLYGLNGSAILASPWHEQKIVSNHVVRIIPSKRIRPGYLQMVLGHPEFGRPLVLREAFGTEVPEIAPETLREFPVVRLPAKEEDGIADRVESASSLRIKADEEENAAAAAAEQETERILGEPRYPHALPEAVPRAAEVDQGDQKKWGS